MELPVCIFTQDYHSMGYVGSADQISHSCSELNSHEKGQFCALD